MRLGLEGCRQAGGKAHSEPRQKRTGQRFQQGRPAAQRPAGLPCRSGSRASAVAPTLCCGLAVAWGHFFNLLGLSFLICIMGAIILVAACRVTVRIRRVKRIKTAPGTPRVLGKCKVPPSPPTHFGRGRAKGRNDHSRTDSGDGCSRLGTVLSSPLLPQGAWHTVGAF